MAGFHHPGDPYFPNQGNNGWLEEEEEPEEEPEEDPEEESDGEPEAEVEGEPVEPEEDEELFEEELDDSEGGDSDAESEVIDPPYPIRVPAYRVGPTGPTPPWGIDLWRWSRHQGQRPPFGMSREFFDLRDGGPADRALPVMVRRLRDTGDLAQGTADQVRQLWTRVERAEQETRDVLREFHMRQVRWESRLQDAERLVARLQGASTSSAPPPDAAQRG